MKATLKLTLDGLLRTLRGRAIRMADAAMADRAEKARRAAKGADGGRKKAQGGDGRR